MSSRVQVWVSYRVAPVKFHLPFHTFHAGKRRYTCIYIGLCDASKAHNVAPNTEENAAGVSKTPSTTVENITLNNNGFTICGHSLATDP